MRRVAKSEFIDEACIFVALRVSSDCLRSIADFSSLVPAHEDEIRVPPILETDRPSNKSVAPVTIIAVPTRCIVAVSIDRLRLPQNLREEDGENALQMLLTVGRRFNTANASFSNI